MPVSPYELKMKNENVEMLKEKKSAIRIRLDLLLDGQKNVLFFLWR